MANNSKKMGRPRTDFARQFFIHNGADHYSYCQVENCNARIKGDHHGNLEKHIRCVHKEEYAAVSNEKNVLTAKRQRSKSLSIDVDFEALKDACVELVTINGQPHDLIDDSGFRRLLDPLLDASFTDETISSDNIGILVSQKAKQVRTSIRSEISGKLMSLKVDGVTHQDRAFLGINVQFIENGKIHIRTLAIIELFETPTAMYLETMIQEVLEEYDITVSNIYSFTCGNASNLVKFGKSLMKNQSMVDEENESKEEGSDNIIDGIKDDLSPNDGDDALFQNLKLCRLTNDASSSCSIEYAAHTLQLAVADALKEIENAENLIQKARKVVAALQTPTIKKAFRLSSTKVKKPRLDVDMQWNLTANMLESLVGLKNFCQNFSTTYNDLEMSEDEWQAIEDYLKSLAPAKRAIIMLQDEQLTLGSYFGLWEECKCNIAVISTKLAQELIKAMRNREKQLLQDDALLASVYLDPRFLPLLPRQYYPAAIAKLANVWTVLEQLDNNSRAVHLNTSANMMEDGNQTNKGVPAFSEKFRRILEKANADRILKASMAFDIHKHLEEYDSYLEYVDLDTDILLYWESKKNTMPQLYRLARVVHAAPANHVTVNRLLSALNFDSQTTLTSKELNDTLVIRSNDQNINNTGGELIKSRRQRRRTESDAGSSESSTASTLTDPYSASRSPKDIFD